MALDVCFYEVRLRHRGPEKNPIFLDFPPEKGIRHMDGGEGIDMVAKSAWVGVAWMAVPYF